MKRVVLFPSVTDGNSEKIASLLFPPEIHGKTFAFVPSDGVDNCKQEYIDQWQNMAQKYNANFVTIDILADDIDAEIEKVNSSTVLVLSGGNTFTFLHHLRNSGLDKAILHFTRKEQFVLAGYSAGALVLTPSIEVCTMPKFDDNLVGITDFAGLGVVDFEVFPHYDVEDEPVVYHYSAKTHRPLRTISDDGYIELTVA